MKTALPASTGLAILVLTLQAASLARQTHAAVICSSYTNFASTGGLALAGSAAVTNGVLRLTPAQDTQTGDVWLQAKQDCAAGFDTTFHFRISELGNIFGNEPGGDGFTFSVQNVGPTNLAWALGGASNYFSVFFNTFWNWPGCTDYSVCDLSGNSVAVLTNQQYVTQADLNPLGINMSDGAAHKARISFDGAGLTVWVDNVVVLTNIPVPGLRPGTDGSGRGWVGFTAGTGAAYENHDILDWSFCATTSLPACASAPSGLVSWWRAEGDALDSADANHGMLVADAAYGPGRVGQAFVFDGAGDAVSVGNPSNLHLQNLTVEAWIRRASPLIVTHHWRGNGLIFGYGFGGYAFYLNNAGQLFLTKVGVDNVGAGVSITDTNWHHVAVTKAGSNVVFYVDGVAYPAPAYHPGFVFSTPATIGARGDEVSDNFLGAIDELGIYNRPLSAGEIQVIYQAGSAGKCAPTNPPSACTPPPAGLISWWAGEANALDQTGGNHGTLEGNTTYTAGRAGLGFVFDGDRDGVVVGTNTNLHLQDFSIEGWIKRSSATVASFNGNGNGTIFAVGPGGGGYNFFVRQSDNWLTLAKSQVNQVSSGALVADTNWHHVAVTKAGTTVVFYVDGVAYPAPAYDAGGYSFAAPGYIGAWLNPYGQVDNSFYGVIDEVAVYGRQLSAAEIQAIYQAGSAGKCAPAGGLPTIVSQPANLTVNAGEAADFAVTAVGTEPLTFQWFFDSNAIPGATNPVYLVASAQPADAGGYSVIVSNAFGSVTSSVATLTVLTFPPTITAQPQSRTVFVGKTVSFSVAASGTAPVSYQWFFNESPLAGKTNATLTLLNVQSNQAGLYRATVTNAYGTATSSNALLTVLPAPVCIAAPTGAIAWWPGESNTWDVVGGFDGHFGSPPPPAALTYTTGKVGAALFFSGSWYLTVPTGGALKPGADGSLSIEGWVRPDAYAPMPLAEWNDGRGSVGAGLFLSSTGPGVIEATLTDTNVPVKAVTLRSAAYAVSNLIWQHVALTYDNASGVATIYVNGLVVAQTNAGPMMPNTSGEFYLAYRRSGPYSGARFRGGLDEFSLYSRALTSAEIQAIVAADEAGKCLPPTPPCVTATPDVTGWWRGESNAVDMVAGSHGAVYPTNYPPSYHYQTGQVGAAFSFNGPNYVAVPPADILDVGKADGLTIEAWINPRTLSPMPIVEWTDTNNFGANFWISYYRSPGVLEANLIDTGGGFQLIQSPINALTYNTWQHVAVSYDKASGLATLYVNGNTVAQTNLGSFTPRTDTGLFLGYHPRYTGPSGYGAPPPTELRFIGAMDEVTIYRRALTSGQIRNIARSRLGKCLELPPAIGRQPRDQVALEGGAATFDVTAGGTAPLSYQWLREGQPIAGATASTLALVRLQLADAGAFSVIVSNTLGAVTSRAARLTVLPANQCLPPAAGIVSLWRGESNTWDEVGGHTAQWGTNTPPGYTNGLVGRAFRFNGTSYLQVPAHPDLNVLAGAGFTVEGWIRPDSIHYNQPLVDWNDGLGNVGVGLMLGRTGPGVLEVTLTDTNVTSTAQRIVTFATTNFVVGSPTNPYPGWTHIALTFDTGSSRASLYVNGRLVAQRTIGLVQVGITYKLFTPSTTGDLFFGWRRSGLYSGQRFRGAMDEMTVYYRALAETEIQAIYMVGSNGKCPAAPPVCLPPAAEIAGWWRGESNALDSVDVNHGLMSPSAGSYTNGRVGTAFALRGGSYVFVRSPKNLDVGTGPGLTVEAWIKPEWHAYPHPIVSWEGTGSTQGMYFECSMAHIAGDLLAHLRGSKGESRVVLSPRGAIKSGQWQHVAATYDRASGQAMLFVNGSPVTVTNVGIFTPLTTGSLYFGYRRGYSARCDQDEIAVYRRALTPDEITAIYRNTGNTCMNPPVIAEQPVDVHVNQGGNAIFSVLATGNPLLRYQWNRGMPGSANAYPLKDATNAMLLLTNVQPSHSGPYSVRVTNAFGAANSTGVWLRVNRPPVADATATRSPALSSDGVNATVVLDGSRSSDPDGDPLQYFWFETGAAIAFATGVVAVATLPVGSHALTLVVDDGLATGRQDFAVEVITAAQAAQRLVDLVNSGAPRPQPLLATLQAAIAAIDRSNPRAALNQLRAFQNQVRAQVAPLDPVLAESFIQQAQEVIDVLSNDGSAPPASKARGKFNWLARQANGEVRVHLSARAGTVQIIQASTNLVDWEMIGAAVDRGDGTFEFEDANAARFPTRYYRIVTP